MLCDKSDPQVSSFTLPISSTLKVLRPATSLCENSLSYPRTRPVPAPKPTISSGHTGARRVIERHWKELSLPRLLAQVLADGLGKNQRDGERRSLHVHPKVVRQSAAGPSNDSGEGCTAALVGYGIDIIVLRRGLCRRKASLLAIQKRGHSLIVTGRSEGEHPVFGGRLEGSSTSPTKVRENECRTSALLY